MSNSPAILQLGARVEVVAGFGTIRFVGPTSFSIGKWVGVELDTPAGKNDGSVDGKRYFNTAPNHGMFVRPAMIKLIEDEPEATPARPLKRPGGIAPRPSSGSSSRPSSAAARPSLTPAGHSSRQSISGSSSITPDSRSSSPAKLQSRASLSKTPSISRTPKTVAPPPSVKRTPSARPVVNTSASNYEEPYFPPPSPSPVRRTTLPVNNLRKGLTTPIGTKFHSRNTSITSNLAASFDPPPLQAPIPAERVSSPTDIDGSLRFQRTISPAHSVRNEESELEVEQEVSRDLTAEEPPASPIKKDHYNLSGLDTRKAVDLTVPKKEYDELLAKMRILEARRAEDREKLRDAEKAKEEGEDWAKLKEKTKAKITELSAELRDIRRINKELMVERDSFEEKFADLTDQVEISLLDKEVAEERFEVAELAAAELEDKIAELQVELGVLREANQRMEGAGDAAIADGTPNSLAFIQLEKQNERLKDAVVKMRDLTYETEQDYRRQITDLTKELDLSADLQSAFENTLVELTRAETQVEELKLQLDDALGAEELIEQMTDRNLALTEKIEQLTATIEDLEALQELSNELEEGHVETEKDLQAEIDLKDMLLREKAHRAETLEERITDYEGTITQFRDLVYSLQSEMATMKEAQEIQLTDAQSLTSQSQAMLNLNMKLQSTMLKGQIKTIDLELRKLDAQQATEHLSMIMPYVLPSFVEEDADAVDAILFFERLSYKADLINMIIEQTHNLTEGLNSTVPERLVAVCETRARISRYSNINKRFASYLKRCPPNNFLKMGQVHREVASTEKRIDFFIEALRLEELKEADCRKEIDGLLAQLEHLAETYLTDPALDIAERERAHVCALDMDFDVMAASAGYTKQSLVLISREPGAEQLDILEEAVFEPLQTLVSQSRSCKVVTKKLLRRLDELLYNSSALSLEFVQGFETLAFNSSAIAAASIKIATDISSYCAEIKDNKEPLVYDKLIKIAQTVVSQELGRETTKPFHDVVDLLNQLQQDISTSLSASSESDHSINLVYDAPWLERVKELQAMVATNVEAERTVIKLNEELRDLLREMRAKDQTIQESAVRIELMDKRMEAGKKQLETISELETELNKSKKQEKAYEEAIEALQGDLDSMEQENIKLKQAAPAADKTGTTQNPEVEAQTFEGTMETSWLVEQIDGLRGAVKFLRSENSYLKSQSMLQELNALPLVIAPPKETNVDPIVAQQSFADLSKQLLKEARLISCTPRVVDLSSARPGGKANTWIPKSRDPIQQYIAEKDRVKDLAKKVEKLWTTRTLGVRT